MRKNLIIILDYDVDTGPLILLIFEDEDISYLLCFLLLPFVRYLHHPYHMLFQKPTPLSGNRVADIEKLSFKEKKIS